MKMKPANHSGGRAKQRGSAVLVVLTLLATMAVFAAATRSALARLDSELKLVESRQTQRLAPPPAKITNPAPSK